MDLIIKHKVDGITYKTDILKDVDLDFLSQQIYNQIKGNEFEIKTHILRLIKKLRSLNNEFSKLALESIANNLEGEFQELCKQDPIEE